jgi:AAHS family 4-hydroxybenzoate transporter-like MFS transporter
MSDASAGMGGGRTVDQVIDDARLSGYQVAAMIMAVAVLFLDGFDIQTMSLVLPSVVAEWGAPPAADLADASLWEQIIGSLLAGPSGALAAANFGVLVASFLIGPLGDYVGRKPLALGALILVAICTLGATTAENFNELMIWRFFTGVGLGAGMPNAYALATEVAPTRLRSTVLVLAGSAVAAGAMTAGFVAPWLMQFGDWRMVFYAGGFLPLGVAIALFFLLPESPRLLAARRWGDPRIGKFLARIHPGQKVDIVPGSAGSAPKVSVAALFRRDFLAATLLLWASYTLLSFILYLLIGWLPSLLTGMGWPLADAQRGAVMIQLGGIIGGLFYAWYMRTGQPHRALIAAMILSVIAIAAFRLAPPSNTLVWSVVITALGAGVSGGLVALIALCGGAYPASMRATGLSWMVGVSRFAAAVSPLVGGALLAMGMTPLALLSILIVPILIAAAGAFLLPRAMAKTVA